MKFFWPQSKGRSPPSPRGSAAGNTSFRPSSHVFSIFCVVLFFLSAVFRLFIYLSCSCIGHVAWIKLIELNWNTYTKTVCILEARWTSQHSKTQETHRDKTWTKKYRTDADFSVITQYQLQQLLLAAITMALSTIGFTASFKDNISLKFHAVFIHIHIHIHFIVKVKGSGFI